VQNCETRFNEISSEYRSLPWETSWSLVYCVTRAKLFTAVTRALHARLYIIVTIAEYQCYTYYSVFTIDVIITLTTTTLLRYYILLYDKLLSIIRVPAPALYVSSKSLHTSRRRVMVEEKTRYVSRVWTSAGCAPRIGGQSVRYFCRSRTRAPEIFAGPRSSESWYHHHSVVVEENDSCLFFYLRLLSAIDECWDGSPPSLVYLRISYTGWRYSDPERSCSDRIVPAWWR